MQLSHIRGYFGWFSLKFSLFLCLVMTEIWCSLFSAVTLYELLKPTEAEKLIMKLLCHKSVGSSTYDCMLVLNRFLTGLLQILGLAIGNITHSSCLQLKCSCSVAEYRSFRPDEVELSSYEENCFGFTVNIIRFIPRIFLNLSFLAK